LHTHKINNQKGTDINHTGTDKLSLAKFTRGVDFKNGNGKVSLEVRLPSVEIKLFSNELNKLINQTGTDKPSPPTDNNPLDDEGK